MFSLFARSKKARLTLAGILAAAGISTIAWNHNRSETVQIQTGVRVDTTYVQDTIPAVKGDIPHGSVAWNLIKNHYKLTSDAAIIAKIRELAPHNLAVNPEALIDDRRTVRDSTGAFRIEYGSDGIPLDRIKAEGQFIYEPERVEERPVITTTPVYEQQKQKVPANKNADLLGILFMSGAILAGSYRPADTNAPRTRSERKKKAPQQQTLPKPKTTLVAKSDEPREETKPFTFTKAYDTPIEIPQAPSRTEETPSPAPRKRSTTPLSAIDFSSLRPSENRERGLGEAIEYLRKQEKSGAFGNERQVIDTSKLDPRLRATPEERAAARAPIAPVAKPEDTAPTYDANQPTNPLEHPIELPPHEVERFRALERKLTPALPPPKRQSQIRAEVFDSKVAVPVFERSIREQLRNPDQRLDAIKRFERDGGTHRKLVDVVVKIDYNIDVVEEEKREQYIADLIATIHQQVIVAPATVREAILNLDPTAGFYMQQTTPRAGTPTIPPPAKAILLAVSLGATAAEAYAQPLEERVLQKQETKALPAQQSSITYIPATHTAHVHEPKRPSPAEKLAAQRASYEQQLSAQGVSAEQRAMLFGEHDGTYNIPVDRKDERSVRRSYVDQMRAQGMKASDIATVIGMSTSTVYNDLGRQREVARTLHS